MSAAKTPFRLFGRAPLLLAALVCLLALPAAVGFLRNNAQSIQEEENRAMAAFPPLALWQEHAPNYIAACEKHLKDVVGFRRQASVSYLKMRYHLFHDPPINIVTMGREGHVFLNSPQAPPYSFFKALCLESGDPPPELLQGLDAVMAAATRSFGRRGARVIFAFIPTSPALYADKLPPAVPPELRRACMAYPQRDHAIARLQRRAEATGHYRVFYPLDLFNAHKHEDWFWPRERFHWEGRSTYLFTRHLFRESGAFDREAVRLDDPAAPGPVGDDLRTFFGFTRPIRGLVYPYAGRPMLEKNVRWITKFGRTKLLRRLVTEGALSDKRALLIANSFGEALKPHLARGFAQLYVLDTNHLAPERQTAVFAAVAERIRPDYVFFVFDDTNLTNLPQWLAGFVELDRQAAQPSSAPPPSPNGSSREKSGL